MRRFAASAVTFVMAALVATSAVAQADKPATVRVIGQLLTLEGGYLVFTTGDAVRVEPSAKLPKQIPFGAFVRATLDPQTRTIVALEVEPKRLSDADFDAVHLPREYVVASPASLRSLPPSGTGNGRFGARSVTVTIDVHVPASTPINDDIYLATDRTDFSPSELRMLRLDAETWSVSIDVPPGTQLRYEFTRGAFSSIERDRRGGLVEPRTLKPTADATVHDRVAAWADVN
jgi:hypothetical protein